MDEFNFIIMIVIHVAIVRAEWKNVFPNRIFGDKQFKCMNEIVTKGEIPFSSSIIMYIIIRKMILKICF